MTAHILDFRNRPPLPPFASLFDIKRDMLGSPLKRRAIELWFRWLTKSLAPAENKGIATMTPSMAKVGAPDALSTWWHEIDAAGISAIACNGRLSDDRGSIDAASLAELQAKHPQRFFGLAPANLEIEPAATVAECEHAVKVLGLRGVNIEPSLRKRGGPTHVDHPDLYPLYEAMSALAVPVMVYTSPFAGPNIDLANDMAPYLRVLKKFRQLKLILGHGGYPRVREVIEAALQCNRLFVCPDMYAFSPGGHLYRENIDALQDQFLFGTSYPFSSMAEPVQATLSLPLRHEVMRKYMWENGARLLGIGTPS